MAPRFDSKDNRNSSGITKLVTGRANFGYPEVNRKEIALMAAGALSS